MVVRSAWEIPLASSAGLALPPVVAIVLNASKNVCAPGAGFAAYSAAKSAQAQLGRIAAMENGAHGIRVNLVNADGIFGDSRLWTDELKRERAAAHGIDVSRIEEFYAGRNLLKRPITADHVAEAVLVLAGDRASRTTGCMLTVDGGVPAAFPR